MPRKKYPYNGTNLAGFDALLERAGMNRLQLASDLGLNPGTISTWGRKIAVPKMAVAYLELKIAYNRVRPD